MSKASLATGLVSACLLGTASIALAAEPGTEDPNNWPQYNRTANAWRYSPLDQIKKDNVGKLSVAWIAHGGDITMGLQETPIVIDGVIYSISRQALAVRLYCGQLFGSSVPGSAARAILAVLSRQGRHCPC